MILQFFQHSSGGSYRRLKDRDIVYGQVHPVQVYSIRGLSHYYKTWAITRPKLKD